MKNKVAFVLLLSMCLMLFAGCNNEPKTLYQSDGVTITREGNITLVSDLVADKEYSFRSVRVKRSESVSVPYKSIDTDTINIETMPSGFRIYDKTADKIIYISAKKFTQ